MLDASAVGAPLCDSALHRVLVSGRSSILDYGIATRTIPANLFNALVICDRHCRFLCCDRPLPWCEGHHVWTVEDGVPPPWTTWCCCADAIMRLHGRGWRMKLLPDATVEATDPAGR